MAFSLYLFTGKILQKNSVWNAFGTLSFLDPLHTTLKMSGYALMFDAQDYCGFSLALVFGFEEKTYIRHFHLYYFFKCVLIQCSN